MPSSRMWRMAAGVPLAGVVCGDPTVPKRSGSGGFLSKQHVPLFYRIVILVAILTYWG